MPAYRPIAERLIEKVDFDPHTHCMIFTGSLSDKGYGMIFGGKDMPGETRAHRAAYRIWCGEIGEGLEIDHRCNNRACINPQHLQAVTHSENARYMDRFTNNRNRQKTACKHGHEYTAENTIVEFNRGKQRRKCRACKNMQQNIAYHSKKKVA